MIFSRHDVSAFAMQPVGNGGQSKLYAGLPALCVELEDAFRQLAAQKREVEVLQTVVARSANTFELGDATADNEK